MSEGEKQWFFKDSDFEPFSVNDEQLRVMAMRVRYRDMFSFEVQSNNNVDVWYTVTHDLSQIIGCQCRAGDCKHKQRGEIVLLKRRYRVYEQEQERKQQERRDKSSLNTGNSFQFER